MSSETNRQSQPGAAVGDVARELGVLDTANIDHIGLVVEDLEASMAEVAREFGLTWQRVRSDTIPARVGDNIHASGGPWVTLRSCLSTSGPPRIELIESCPDSVWEAAGGGNNLHHIGIRVGDIAEEASALEARGFKPEVSGLPYYAYYNSLLGVRVELLRSAHEAALNPPP